MEPWNLIKNIIFEKLFQYPVLSIEFSQSLYNIIYYFCQKELLINL